MLSQSMLSTAWSNSSPLLTVFALHPGYIKSQLSTGGDNSNTGGIVFDAGRLPVATKLYLTSGCIGWLNGKSVR
ncbi:hypothetical protein EDB86DRAFT_2969699 [Lactarius hatsudake]|nr:hypothetical protein EDB86DRAFT_2969699 [Lactarius hatsudake]